MEPLLGSTGYMAVPVPSAPPPPAPAPLPTLLPGQGPHLWKAGARGWGRRPVAVRSPLVTTRHPPQLHLLYVFPVSSTERETGRAAFLGIELNPDQVKSGQWTLLALSFVMLLAVLLLGRRLYTLEKTSLTQDTSTQDTRSQGTQSQNPTSQDANAIKPASKTYFLGIAMEPHQVVKRQWMLLGLCLFLMLCSIGLLIRIFTQHNRKPPWMRDEWGSWD